jgi:hypothetical protein
MLKNEKNQIFKKQLKIIDRSLRLAADICQDTLKDAKQQETSIQKSYPDIYKEYERDIQDFCRNLKKDSEFKLSKIRLLLDILKDLGKGENEPFPIEEYQKKLAAKKKQSEKKSKQKTFLRGDKK